MAVVAYDVVEWHDLFVAVAGAAGALTGLIFVAVSINLQQILAVPLLPLRAAESLGVLVSLLVTSIFILTPGQSRLAIGLELAGLGALMLALIVVSLPHRRPPVGSPRHWMIVPLAVVVASTAPVAVAGISEIAARGGGLYWLLPQLVIGFVGSVYNGWILLVEILR